MPQASGIQKLYYWTRSTIGQETNGKNMSSSIGIVPRTSVGELLKVVGLPTKSDRTIGTNELIKEIVRLIDNQVSVTATQRTTEDFVKIRSEVFPNYVSAMMSLGSFAKNS